MPWQGNPGDGGDVCPSPPQARQPGARAIPAPGPCSARVELPVRAWRARVAEDTLLVPWKRSGTFLFVAGCWQQDTGYPPRKMDGLLASTLPLQAPACHLPPFPPSLPPSNLPRAELQLSREVLHETPRAAEAPMSPQPQRPRYS